MWYFFTLTYDNIISMCFSYCRWIFDENLSNNLTLVTIPPKHLSANDNDNKIYKYFCRVRMEMIFVPQYVNIMKYKSLIQLDPLIYIPG